MAKKKLTLDDMQKYFKKIYTGKCCKAYSEYVKDIDDLCIKIGEKSVAERIMNIIDINAKDSPDDPVGDLTKDIKQLLDNSCCGWKKKDKQNHISGFRMFAKVVLGFFYANTWLNMGNFDMLFCKLISENALFATPDVVKDVREGKLGSDESKNCAIQAGIPLDEAKYNNPYASWDYMAHCRDNKLDREAKVNKKKQQTKPDPDWERNHKLFPGINKDIKVDNNNCANQAIKRAILESYKKNFLDEEESITYLFERFKDYEVCHVWDEPGDRRYYASICNLVLIPSALAKLTDHNDAVKSLLRNKVYDLFRFIPEEETLPKKPKNYKNFKWRTI